MRKNVEASKAIRDCNQGLRESGVGGEKGDQARLIATELCRERRLLVVESMLTDLRYGSGSRCPTCCIEKVENTLLAVAVAMGLRRNENVCVCVCFFFDRDASYTGTCFLLLHERRTLTPPTPPVFSSANPARQA